MPSGGRFEWELLKARKKHLKKESRRVVRDIRNLLSEQEHSPNHKTRLLRTDAIFSYLATPAAARVLEDHPDLRISVRNKLIELNELGVEAAPRWGAAMGMNVSSIRN
jgi:DNA-binding transcriptional LysR family regulator